MKYCSRCLYPANHPLNITFDEQGVCSGCRVHEEKDVLDWHPRREKLAGILGAYRNRAEVGYDCIVPVSGARDSYFIVHTLRKEFGLNPLLVSYNKHYNTRRGIRNLSYLRTLLDVDLIDTIVGADTVKNVTRWSLRELGSMYWHCLAGETVFPVQVAVRFKIPLIVWGVHQGCDQVGMFSHLDEVEMTRKYRKEHDVLGVEAEDIANATSDISESDLTPFTYPHDKEIEKIGVRGIYLSNYIRWDTKAQHEKMIALYGYESAPQHRTFDSYNDVDSIHYSGIHDYIKYLKWGFGKASDHASREIRLKRLSREEGIDLVRRYQELQPPDIRAFLDWIDLSEEEFRRYLDNHRDPRIWRRDGKGQWTLLDSIDNHVDDPGVDAVRLEKKEGCEFAVSPSREPEADESEAVILTRGWVDGLPADSV